MLEYRCVRRLKVFSPLFRLTFAMYGGLSTKCMEAGNLSKLAISLHPDAVAKLRGGVGHKYRVRRAGGGVRHAAAPRNRRWLPYGVSRGGSSVKFKIYPQATSSTRRLTIWAALAAVSRHDELGEPIS